MSKTTTFAKNVRYDSYDTYDNNLNFNSNNNFDSNTFGREYDLDYYDTKKTLIAEDKLRDALLEKVKLEQKVSQLEVDLIAAQKHQPANVTFTAEMKEELRQKDIELEGKEIFEVEDLRQKDLLENDDLKMLREQLNGYEEMQQDLRSYKTKHSELRPRIRKETEEFQREVDDIERELKGKFGEEEAALNRLRRENAMKQDELDYLRELMAKERRENETLQQTHATEQAEIDHLRRLNTEEQRKIDQLIAEKNALLRSREMNEGEKNKLLSEMRQIGGMGLSHFDVELLRGQKMELENEINFLKQTAENEQRRLNNLEQDIMQRESRLRMLKDANGGGSPGWLLGGETPQRRTFYHAHFSQESNNTMGELDAMLAGLNDRFTHLSEHHEIITTLKDEVLKFLATIDVEDLNDASGYTGQLGAVELRASNRGLRLHIEELKQEILEQARQIESLEVRNATVSANLRNADQALAESEALLHQTRAKNNVSFNIPNDYNKTREISDLKDQIAVWKSRHEVQERAALKEKDESMTYQALNAELQEQNSQLRAVMMNKNHLLEELKEQPQHVYTEMVTVPDERNEEMRVQITELSDMLNFVEKENEELKTQIRHTRSTSARRDSPRTSGADYRRKCEVLEDRLHAKEIVLQKLTKERDHLENDLSRIRSGGPGTHELLKDVENLEKQNRILEEMCRVYDDALTKAVTDTASTTGTVLTELRQKVTVLQRRRDGSGSVQDVPINVMHRLKNRRDSVTLRLANENVHLRETIENQYNLLRMKFNPKGGPNDQVKRHISRLLRENQTLKRSVEKLKATIEEILSRDKTSGPELVGIFRRVWKKVGDGEYEVADEETVRRKVQDFRIEISKAHTQNEKLSKKLSKYEKRHEKQKENLRKARQEVDYLNDKLTEERKKYKLLNHDFQLALKVNETEKAAQGKK